MQAKKECSRVQTFCKSHVCKHSCCDAGLEMGVSQHDYHQLLWYKGRGFPQYCLIFNSSKQLYQRSILSTFCSHLQVSSPLLLRYGTSPSFSIYSVLLTSNSLAVSPPNGSLPMVSLCLSHMVSLCLSHTLFFLTLSYLSLLSLSSSSRTCFLLSQLS